MTQVALAFLVIVAVVECAALGMRAAHWMYEHRFDSEFSNFYFATGPTHSNEWDKATRERYSDYFRKTRQYEDELRGLAPHTDRGFSLGQIFALAWSGLVLVGVPIATLVLIRPYPTIQELLGLLILAVLIPGIFKYIFLERRNRRASAFSASSTGASTTSALTEPKRLM